VRTTGHANFAGMIIPSTPFLITPNDDADLNDNGYPTATRALSFAVAGALSVVTVDGNSVIIPSGALAAGTMHSIAIRRVNATGTTATGIVGYS